MNGFNKDDFGYAFLADIEASFDVVPELDRRTFALPCFPLLIQASGGPVHCLAWPVGVLARYRGSLRDYADCQVEILGRCDCDVCHFRREAAVISRERPTRYVARILGTSKVLRHSRPTSYVLPLW